MNLYPIYLEIISNADGNDFIMFEWPMASINGLYAMQ